MPSFLFIHEILRRRTGWAVGGAPAGTGRLATDIETLPCGRAVRRALGSARPYAWFLRKVIRGSING